MTNENRGSLGTVECEVQSVVVFDAFDGEAGLLAPPPVDISKLSDPHRWVEIARLPQDGLECWPTVLERLGMEHQIEQLTAAVRLTQDVNPSLPHAPFIELQSIQQLKIVGYADWNLDQVT